MGRRSRKSRNEKEVLDGGIVVWKPRGPSSRQVVNRIQRQLGFRGLGHCGTLDPLASGVMVLTGGLGSKFQQWLTVHDKSYVATIWWGLGSDSGDAEGPLWSPDEPVVIPSRAAIESVLPQFLGVQLQVPPRHSAIRVDGRRSYEEARAGVEVDMKPREVRVDALELLEVDGPRCRLRVDCGPGTYIRSLAQDLGSALEVPATLIGLQRTACGIYTLADSIRIDQIGREEWWSLERLVDHLPKQELTEPECRALAQGQQIPGEIAEERVAWSAGWVQGILEPADEGSFKARRWLSRGIRNPESTEETG